MQSSARDTVLQSSTGCQPQEAGTQDIERSPVAQIEASEACVSQEFAGMKLAATVTPEQQQ